MSTVYKSVTLFLELSVLQINESGYYEDLFYIYIIYIYHLYIIYRL